MNKNVYTLSYCEAPKTPELLCIFSSFENAKKAMFEIMAEDVENVIKKTFPLLPTNNIGVCYWSNDKDFYRIEEYALDTVY